MLLPSQGVVHIPLFHPRRIQYAGSETDGLSVDYKQKYAQQLQVIKDNYATFAVPYNGEDNNDYVDGKGFCCNDGSLEAAQARAMAASIAKAKAVNGNFKENDDYEKMQFYYHPDHLGSSSYITNLDGEVVQHIEYVPFGEVFVEERNNIWNTPYLFNAKEFDEETGLYYYGARYYDPRLSLWLTVDPMQEKHLSLSTYSYTFNNPIRLQDYEGEEPITAIIEGITAFSVSAGVDFISSWLIEGKDCQTAFRSIAWGAAAVDGLTTCALSVVASGTGTAKTMAKIANSKAGRFTIDVTQTMISNVVAEFEKGQIESFSDLNLQEEFMFASFQTLLSKGLGKRADELLESLKGKNATLYNRMAKYKQNESLGKNTVRLKSDKHKVEVAKGESAKTTAKYVTESVKSNGTAGVGTSAVRNEADKRKKK